MAQGKLKAKVQAPGKGKQKSQRPTKNHVLRKGHLSIKPKKGKELQTFKLKKNLQKAINSNIEQDVSLKASSIEPKSFKLLKKGGESGASTSKSKSTKMPSHKSHKAPSCLYGPTNTYELSSPIGKLVLTSCPKGIHSLGQETHINDDNFLPDLGVDVEVISQLYKDNGYAYKPAMQCAQWLKSYFHKHTTITYPPVCLSISKKGSFTEKVWKTLPEKVQFGECISYGKLAELCGNQNASRAVGAAMKTNPIMILMPCHRVIQSSGELGNYHGGTRNSVKVWLLKHEGAIE